jgi:hypothetical protein
VNSSLSRNNLHSQIRDIRFKFDELVIGSSLECLVYSYKRALPLIYTKYDKPNELESLPPTLILDEFGLSNSSKIIHSNHNTEEVGINKIHLWDRLYFFLSLSGQIPLSEPFVSIRVSGSHLKATTSKARMVKIEFNKLIIFNHFDIYGIDYKLESSSNKFKVYDYFAVRSGMKHSYDYLCGESDFIKKVKFYPSDRIDGNHDLKDATAVSYLTSEELGDFEYSDINARFKTLFMMKKAGIRGTRNGRDQNDKTKFKFYALKIENVKRIIEPPIKIYSSYDNIFFNNEDLSDIINYNLIPNQYISKIML